MIADTYHQSVNAKRKSKNIIHVNVGLYKDKYLLSHEQISNNEKRSSITQNTPTIHRMRRSMPKLKDNRVWPIQLPLKGRNSMKNVHVSRSSKVSVLENKNEVVDRTVTTDDNHEKSHANQKKKCINISSIRSVVVILLILLTIAGILLGVLIIPSRRTTTSVLRWNATGTTIVGMVNSSGNANNQLDTPVDIAIDHANNLYVADRSNHRIQKFSSGSSTGQTVAGNGTLGNFSAQLNFPSGAIIDSNGNFYITDTSNQRVLFWRNGDVNGSIVAGITGSLGNATNELNTPFRTVLHPTSGSIYIADTHNHRIMSYASGVSNGILVLGGNGGGTNTNQLNYPVGLYFDSLSDSLIIANFAANNIVRYTLGANSWTLVAGHANGSAGAESTEFTGPTDMTFDPMGNMYVADRDNHRIQFFYNEQSIGTTIAGITGVNDSNATTLHQPWSVRLDSQLNLYVADTFNHRIQKFLRY